jgi:hypothetical protein
MAPVSSNRMLRDKLGGLVEFNEKQHAIHEGCAYIISGRTGTGGLAAGGVIELVGVTGDKQLHFDGFGVKASAGNILVELFKGADLTDPGTPVTPKNKNHAYPDASSTAVYISPTVNDNGDVRYSDFAPLTGVGVNLRSGEAGVEEGFVLDVNTVYLFRITNLNTVTAVDLGYRLGWHESNVILKP